MCIYILNVDQLYGSCLKHIFAKNFDISTEKKSLQSMNASVIAIGLFS